MDYDVIVVGSGPAGLSAALVSSYYGLKVLVIESASAGGAPVNKYPWKIVENYLGFKGMTGLEIAKRMVEHAKSGGVEITENETVMDIKKENDFKVITNKSEYNSKSIILALGLGVPQKLGIKNENIDSVIYSISNPGVYKSKNVVVIGGGDSAIESAVELQKFGATVTIVHRKGEFRASGENTRKVLQSGIKVFYNTGVGEIYGDKKVKGVVLIEKETGKEDRLNADVILVSIGTSSNKEFLQRMGIKINERGSVIIDELGRTNIPGIFAAGDIVGKWLRIPEAIGEGGFAGINAFKYVKNPYWG